MEFEDRRNRVEVFWWWYSERENPSGLLIRLLRLKPPTRLTAVYARSLRLEKITERSVYHKKNTPSWFANNPFHFKTP